jgi:hypothetical protein
MKLSKPKKGVQAPAGKKQPFSLSFGKKAKPVEEINPETFIYEPSLPKVNLVPASVSQKYEVKGLLRKFALGGIGGLVVVGLIFAGGTAYTAILNGSVIQAEEEAADLQSQLAVLQPFTQFKTSVEEKRFALAERVQSDVNMGTLYSDIYGLSIINQLELTNVGVTQYEASETIETGACLNPDPFTENDSIIGCATLTASSALPDSGRTFVEAMKELENGKYVNPFISSVITDQDSQVVFEINVSFTDKLYTDQYKVLQTSIAELLDDTSEKSDEKETPIVVETEPAVVAEEEVAPGDNTATFAASFTPYVLVLTPAETNTLNAIVDNVCSTNNSLNQLDEILSLFKNKDSFEEVEAQLPNSINTYCGTEVI